MTVTPTMPLPADATWMHAFDARKGASGRENASIGSALWFYTTMATHGVDSTRVTTAVVVHGPAIFDVVTDARYAAKYGEGERNPSSGTIAELIGLGGEIWVCAVAAEHHQVGSDDLLPGVRFAPAAMIAHADLQRRGFSINPY